MVTAMKMKLVLSHTLVALAFAAAGWSLHAISTADHLTPAKSIAAAWQTQIDVLTTPQGEERSAEDASRIARVSLSTLSMGLAMHYNQLTREQKRQLAPFIPRLRALDGSTDRQTSLAVIECIDAAGETRPIDEACISKAVQP